MNHADIKKHLADYLEGDLALEDRALVDAHLDACDPCSNEVEEMLRTLRLLRTLPEPEIPPMIAANVMRRIRAGESRPGFFQRVARAVGSVLEPTFVLPASAIAVAALVVTVTQGTVFQSDRDGRRSTMTTSERLVAALPSFESSSRSSTRPESLGVSSAEVRVSNPAFSSRSQMGRSEASSAVPRRIRIRIDGSGVARLSMSRGPAMRQSMEPLRPSRDPAFPSAVPEAWAAEFSRVMYGNPVGGTRVSLERPSMTSDGLVRSVTRSQRVSSGRYLMDLESRGADPRDAWIALGFENPVEFAQYIASQNLAEQELWTARLTERAELRGLMGDLLEALRESGDETAKWVADDFEAEASSQRTRESSGGEEATTR